MMSREKVHVPNSTAIPLLTAPQVAEEQQRGTLVLDTRPPEQFASLHLRGSIQISLKGNFASWAAIIIEPARKLLLVAENDKRALEAQNRLVRVGLNHIVGYALAVENQWRAAGLELASIPVKRCEQVHGALHGEPSLQLVDVRSRAEWLQGHLPGAISLPLLDLDVQKRILDPSKPSLVYCHEGFRATTAASILRRETESDISILVDGVEGWSALGLPLERT
jgi:rhodanese-related sulfurtransferase